MSSALSTVSVSDPHAHGDTAADILADARQDGGHQHGNSAVRQQQDQVPVDAALRLGTMISSSIGGGDITTNNVISGTGANVLDVAETPQNRQHDDDVQYLPRPAWNLPAFPVPPRPDSPPPPYDSGQPARTVQPAADGDELRRCSPPPYDSRCGSSRSSRSTARDDKECCCSSTDADCVLACLGVTVTCLGILLCLPCVCLAVAIGVDGDDTA